MQAGVYTTRERYYNTNAGCGKKWVARGCKTSRVIVAVRHLGIVRHNQSANEGDRYA